MLFIIDAGGTKLCEHFLTSANKAENYICYKSKQNAIINNDVDYRL